MKEAIREEEGIDTDQRQHRTQGVTDKLQVRNFNGYIVDQVLGVRYDVTWYTEDGGPLRSWLSRAEVEEYAAWSLLQFDSRQADFESHQLGM